jgi:hypothetical protein
MLMVGKEKHLRLLRELAQYLESSCRPFVVKIDKKIIGDEREWREVTEVIFNGGDA